MSECGDAMSHGSGCLNMLIAIWGVLQSLPRMLVPRQKILFSVLLGNTVSMVGAVM